MMRFLYSYAWVMGMALVSCGVQAGPYHPVSSQEAQAISAAAHDFLFHILPVGTQIQVMPVSSRVVVPDCAAYKGFMYHVPKDGNYATVEVRCLSPRRWSIYVSATLTRFQETFVAQHDMSVGTIIHMTDLIKRRIPLSGGQHYLTESSFLVGFYTNRFIPAGHAFIREDVRLPLLVRSNHPVSVTVQGRGFAVSSHGIALNDAFPGQSVRVKMTRGQVVEGEAVGEGAVRLSF